MGDDGSTLGIGTGEKIALGGKNKFEDVLDITKLNYSIPGNFPKLWESMKIL